MNHIKPENLLFEDFAKLDLRVGTIQTAENIKNSKKLLKLEVFFGKEIGTRIILAGIAGSYQPNLLGGRKVVAVLNLAPRSMMGIESHGMLLASQDKQDIIWLMDPGPIEDGAEVG